MQPTLSPAPSQSPLNLADHLNEVATTATRAVRSAADLESNLQSTYTALNELDLSRFDVANVKQDAPAIMASMFAFQTTLRRRARDWHTCAYLTPGVEKALRDLYRSIRYTIGMLGETSIGFVKLPEDEECYRGFTGPDNNTFVSSEISNAGRVPFRSGDVILVRGRKHNSAAIARIGDVDSQFSHILMVYADANGRLWGLESLISKDGAVLSPLAHSLDHGLGRAMVFRHRDAALARRAAHIMYNRISDSLAGRALPIRYDFSMRLDSHKNLFCSKLVRRAFREASDGKTLLPTYPTTLLMKNRDFIDRIGVKTVGETFAPGDIELEPAFELVAEWQDYRATSDLRLQDMIMDKLFEWMQTHNFRFKETFSIKLISIFGRLSAKLSPTIKEMLSDVVPYVPSNMSRRAVAAIAMLHKTAQPLLEELQELEKSHNAKSGRPLHPREVRLYLESVREKAFDGQIGYLKMKPRR